MNDQSDMHGEENLSQLLKSIYDAGSRPPANTTRQTYQRLLAEMRAKIEPASFPDVAVATIGGLIFLSAIWMLIQSGSLLTNPAAVLLLAGTLINLIVVPVASVVIIRKRSH
ncbi:MAG: hypothetical protein JXA21_27080 [Anaerolineae bacterium]|nr:hypothetical protein [Anaerolineae bacterium]